MKCYKNANIAGLMESPDKDEIYKQFAEEYRKCINLKVDYYGTNFAVCHIHYMLKGNNHPLLHESYHAMHPRVLELDDQLTKVRDTIHEKLGYVSFLLVLPGNTHVDEMAQTITELGELREQLKAGIYDITSILKEHTNELLLQLSMEHERDRLAKLGRKSFRGM